MPTVPTYDNFQATPNAAPDVAVQAPEMPDYADKQLSDFGAGLESAGSAANDLYVKQQTQANQVRAIDADNQLTAYKLDAIYNPQTGFKNLTGAAAFEPNSAGLSPVDQSVQNFQAQVDNISSTLGNDQQRALFRAGAQKQLQSFQQDLMQHQAEQYTSYHLSVMKGAQELAGQQMVADPNNPDTIQQSYDRIKAASIQADTLKGLSPIESEANANVAASAALKNVFDQQIQNGNLQYAQAFMKKYGSSMTANDALAAQGVLLKTSNANLALTTAQDVFRSAAPQLAQTPMSQMYAITAQTESGNKETNADGSTITSPKGAQGSMQVMPATNADPGFGVTPAQDSSPEERARVGRDYLQAMMQRYNNDPRLAWAAYNGGPGNLDAAIAQAKKTGADPVSLMPTETQDYVAKNMAALSSGQGQSAVQMITPTKEQLVDQVTAQLQAQGANPETIKSGQDTVGQMYDLHKQAMDQQKTQAVNAAYAWINAHPQTPVAQMPTSISSAIPPEKQNDVTAYAQRTFKGEDITTVPALFQRAMVDDTWLKSLSMPQLNNLTANMSDSDSNTVTSRYHQLITGKSPTDPGQLNVGLVNGVLNPMLVSANIQVNPKKSSSGTSDDEQRLAAIHNFVYPYLLDVQKANGKQLTQAQITSELNGLFVKNQAFRNTFMGLTTSHGSQPILTSSFSDIPDDIKTQIKSSLAMQGNPNPTDGQVLNQYFRLKLGK